MDPKHCIYLFIYLGKDGEDEDHVSILLELVSRYKMGHMYVSILLELVPRYKMGHMYVSILLELVSRYKMGHMYVVFLKYYFSID